jgi:hypothetical protein
MEMERFGEESEEEGRRSHDRNPGHQVQDGADRRRAPGEEASSSRERSVACNLLRGEVAMGRSFESMRMGAKDLRQMAEGAFQRLMAVAFPLTKGPLPDLKIKVPERVLSTINISRSYCS